MEKKNNQIESWPDLAIGLYDKLTGRNAAITYDFDDFQLDVPSKVGSENTTPWKMNGKLTITTASDSTEG
jgi:hypothetical protein